MNVIPLNGEILIKIKEAEEKIGSIYIPETAQKQTQNGYVLALSSKTELDRDVKINDEVVYDKYSGVHIKVDNEEYLLLKEKDILAVLR